uniref:THAP domain-containing protein 10 n=1 Tax=Lygus hesperus TaxID=30085 RepID=A0A0A9XHZ6_LYGHE
MESTSNVVQKTLTLKKAYVGPRCSVMNCDNTSRKRDELGLDISFHRFPRDLTLQKEWIRRCRPLNYVNILNRQVCSIHFEPQYFCKKHKPNSKSKLVDGALPTLYLPAPEEGDMEEEEEIEETDPLGFDKPQALANRTYEHDIEMVELSSEEEELEVIVEHPIPEDGGQALTSAAALAATSALQIPTKGRPPSAPPKMSGRKGRRKSSAAEKSPTKSVMLMDASMDGSMDSSSKFSDDDCDDEEIILIPNEELEYIDLQDPLEMAYYSWRNMNDKSRRATIRAYLSRLASFLPPRYPRNNKPNIMDSAMRYLDDVTKENAILAIEQEILMQRHYVLRKKRAKLDIMIRKKKKQTD